MLHVVLKDWDTAWCNMLFYPMTASINTPHMWVIGSLQHGLPNFKWIVLQKGQSSFTVRYILVYLSFDQNLKVSSDVISFSLSSIPSIYIFLKHCVYMMLWTLLSSSFISNFIFQSFWIKEVKLSSHRWGTCRPQRATDAQPPALLPRFNRC